VLEHHPANAAAGVVRASSSELRRARAIAADRQRQRDLREVGLRDGEKADGGEGEGGGSSGADCLAALTPSLGAETASREGRTEHFLEYRGRQDDMPIPEELRLRYETLHTFRLSEDRALTGRATVFLALNTLLLGTLAVSPQCPGAVGCIVPGLGIALSLIGIHVGLRLCKSQKILRAELDEVEKHIWPSGDGPYSRWHTAFVSGVRWGVIGPGLPVLHVRRAMEWVSVWPLVGFVLTWVVYLFSR